MPSLSYTHHIYMDMYTIWTYGASVVGLTYIFLKPICIDLCGLEDLILCFFHKLLHVTYHHFTLWELVLKLMPQVLTDTEVQPPVLHNAPGIHQFLIQQSLDVLLVRNVTVERRQIFPFLLQLRLTLYSLRSGACDTTVMVLIQFTCMLYR